MKEEVRKQKGDLGYFGTYVRNRIQANKNMILACTGPTGSGKSWSALRLAELIDPDFEIRNVCFTPREFVDLVNGESKQLTSGSCIVWDELQVSMSNIEFQSLQSKLVNYILSTFRHKNFILIMTTPHFNFVNKTARSLFHCRLETMGINRSAKHCTLKPLMLQVNQRSGDIYQKYLRVLIAGSGLVPLKRLRVGVPSPDLLKDYEAKKSSFTQALNKQISEELDSIEEKKQKKSGKELTLKQREIVEDLREGLVVSDIAKKRSIAERSVFQHLELIKKKGWELLPHKDHSNRVVRYEVLGNEP